LIGKPKTYRPLGISERRWEDTVKVDNKEIRQGSGEKIELAQDVARMAAAFH